MAVVLVMVAAYLIGSVPSAVWIGKVFYSKDVRQFGSGNAGATNTFRVFGKTAGVIVLIMDILKGVAAVSLSHIIKNQFSSPDEEKLLEILLGIIAVAGHIYPVFAHFKGGKGVATLTGVLFIIFPLSALVVTGVFIIVFVASNYISLSSITASLLFPLITYFIYNYYSAYVYSTLLLIPLIVIYTHRTNIKRLISGEENKMYLFRKKAE